jgi:ribosome-associated protein
MKKITVKVKQTAPVPIPVREGVIRLDALLKLANAVESGGQAKLEIQSGQVRVNGEICTQRGKKLLPGDCVRFAGAAFTVAQED